MQTLQQAQERKRRLISQGLCCQCGKEPLNRMSGKRGDNCIRINTERHRKARGNNPRVVTVVKKKFMERKKRWMIMLSPLAQCW